MSAVQLTLSKETPTSATSSGSRKQRVAHDEVQITAQTATQVVQRDIHQAKIFRFVTQAILFEVGSFLSLRDLSSMIRTCKAGVIFSNPIVWKKITNRLELTHESFPTTNARLYVKAERHCTKELIAIYNHPSIKGELSAKETEFDDLEKITYERLLLTLELNKNKLAPHLWIFAGNNMIDCVGILLTSTAMNGKYRGQALCAATYQIKNKEDLLDMVDTISVKRIPNRFLKKALIKSAGRGFRTIFETFFEALPEDAEILGEALCKAASYGSIMIIKLIADRTEIHHKYWGKAFVTAAEQGHRRTLKTINECAEIKSRFREKAYLRAKEKNHVNVLEELSKQAGAKTVSKASGDREHKKS